MPQVNIRIVENGREHIVAANPGDVIADKIIDGGHSLDMPCAGVGRCGKCRVKITGDVSPITPEEQKHLSKAEIADGVRLACCSRALGDITVHMMAQKEMLKETEGKMQDFKLNPPVKVVEAQMAEPTLENQIGDEQNLISVLKQSRIKAEKVALKALRKLPLAARKNNMKINAVCAFGEVVDVGASTALGVAVDIGTTTVAAYFYDLETGKRLGVLSGVNRQRVYGADVISRIQYCITEADGLERLKSAIISQLNGMIESFCKTNSISKDLIYYAVIAGNTTMQHIAAGIPPHNIANAPFIPATLFGGHFKAADIGLDINDEARVYFVPSIASYVGGDITAGILASGINESDKLSLFIDIGTNGEMALGNSSALLACATAAGPAFEGAHIKYGMGGVEGAISSVYLENGSIGYQTIGNVKPEGICGSGIIDAVAVMLELGVVDESGRLVDPDEVDEACADRIVDIDGQNCFVIAKDPQIVITQKDVREIQLAKAAIAAGIDTLLYTLGKSYVDLDAVYIAGGFGAHINKQSACKIGLLPMQIVDKIKVIGNAAGMGSVQALINKENINKLNEIVGKVQYIELSGNLYFQNAYVEQMIF